LSFSFSDANTGTMSYIVNGVTQSKAIVRYVYTAGGTNCSLGGAQASRPTTRTCGGARAERSQAGGQHHAPGRYSLRHMVHVLAGAGPRTRDVAGDVERKTRRRRVCIAGRCRPRPGPFQLHTFQPNDVVRTTVGTGTFTFADANNGTFDYTVNGVAQSKPITRYLFAAPTYCVVKERLPPRNDHAGELARASARKLDVAAMRAAWICSAFGWATPCARGSGAPREDGADLAVGHGREGVKPRGSRFGRCFPLPA
jgi:hypothetical protein